MALNVDQLKGGLDDYHQLLQTHIINTSNDLVRMQQVFVKLQNTYDSERAQEFNEKWRAAASWIQEYLDSMQELDKFLMERRDQLNFV